MSPFVMLACLLAAAPTEGPALRLSGVPQQLTLPLPEGSNQVLAATVTGGTVRSVWLATSADAKLKYSLVKSGAGEYQVNLAEPEVAAALGKEGRGRFQIFTELEGGQVLSSVAVAYTFRHGATGAARVRLFVLFKPDKEPQPIENRPLDCGMEWLSPAEVTGLEVRGEGIAEISAAARAGSGRWELRRVTGEQRYRLDVDDTIRKAWRESGQLRIEYRKQDETIQLGRLGPRPDRLDFPGAAASLVVYQRAAEKLPGAGGYLSLHIGDITRGQTLLDVRTAEGKRILETVSVRQGDLRTLEFGGEQYSLYVRELHNLLIGEDWAVLDVSRLTSAEWKKIETLLARIAEAPITFLREGNEYTGREAAAHLRQKLSQPGPRVTSLDDFIVHYASRSSSTGQPYRVKRADGSIVPAEEWLRQEAQRPIAPKPEAPAKDH